MVRILFIIFISRKNSKLERKKDLLVIKFYFREIWDLDFGIYLSSLENINSQQNLQLIIIFSNLQTL